MTSWWDADLERAAVEFALNQSVNAPEVAGQSAWVGDLVDER